MTFAVVATLLLFQAGGGPPLPNGWDVLVAAQKCVGDRKWNEARAKAEELLARKDLIPNTRAEGEWVLVQTFEATEEWAKDAAACTRALQEKGIPYRSRFHLTKVRALRKSNDGKGAAQAYAQSFEDAAREPVRSTRWSEMNALLSNIVGNPIKSESLLSLLEAAKALKQDKSTGMQAALGALSYHQNQPKEAVLAFDKARAVWKDDPILLRWTVMAATFDRQLDYALSLRKELKALIAVEKKNLNGSLLDSLKPLDERFSETCGYAEDPAMARKFVRTLLGEDDLFGNSNIFGYLLGFIKDEKLIEETDAALAKSVTHPGQRLAARWPAAEAWIVMGKFEKALACYKDVSEANGWSKTDVDGAAQMVAHIQQRAKKP